MSQDLPSNKVSSQYRADSGGASLRTYPIIGIVKNNIDPTHSGRIQVFLNDMGYSNPDDNDSWVTVSYMSPFFGVTEGGTGNTDDFGNYVDSQHSYGFWATPPDLGTMVMCVFVNGDINFGYYIGCIPQQGSTHMVPAIGAYGNVVIGSNTEAAGYGAVPRLPVTELNLNNPAILNNDGFVNQARPLHSYAAATYHRQGLTRDIARGPISSSSQRESPSRVFGMSTPGRPIYSGGYTDENIAKSSSTADDATLKVVGRRGGHSFVMDDGDIAGKDQLVRIRTSQGHQIMMNDEAGTFFIIHANGKSWIELGKEGTIDIFSEDSFNVRTKGDINLRADKNVNIDAGEKLTIAAKNTDFHTAEKMSMRTGTDFSMQTLGKYSVKVSGSMTMRSDGTGSYASSGTMFVNGKKINLNTGAAPAPATVKELKKTAHPDTIFDSTNGFVEAAGLLSSIVSRAPAHNPWSPAGAGIYAAPDPSAAAAAPPAPAAIDSVNSATKG